LQTPQGCGTLKFKIAQSLAHPPFVLTIGPVGRFARSKQIASYLGLNPSEHSSGGKRRLGAISKQGNTMVRWLLIEAAHHAVRLDSGLRRDYQRLKCRRGNAVAKVAIARKLAVRMYWMLRSGADYARLADNVIEGGRPSDSARANGSGCCGCRSRSGVWEECAAFGVEHNMNHVLSVGVGHVSHLRRWGCSYITHPALARWAKLWRA
jgi:hypothetical protein